MDNQPKPQLIPCLIAELPEGLIRPGEIIAESYRVELNGVSRMYVAFYGDGSSTYGLTHDQIGGNSVKALRALMRDGILPHNWIVQE